MTVLDDELRPLAESLIDDYGAVATFHVVDQQHVDLTSGVQSSEERDVTANVTPPEAWSTRPREGQQITQESSVVYLADRNKTFTPYRGLRLTVLGESFVVQAVVRIVSGAEIAMWQLEVAS